MSKHFLVVPKKLSGRNILLYVLAGGVLMWFPVDFIAHEIADLFPETVYYDFSKTVFGFIVLAAVLAIFLLILKRRSLLELSVATAAVMDTVFGLFYYALYYYYPSTLPENAPPNVLVTNLIGLHYVPMPLTVTIIWQFAVIHFFSNLFGSLFAGLIFLVLLHKRS